MSVLFVQIFFRCALVTYPRFRPTLRQPSLDVPSEFLLLSGLPLCFLVRIALIHLIHVCFYIHIPSSTSRARISCMPLFSYVLNVHLQIFHFLWYVPFVSFQFPLILILLIASSRSLCTLSAL